jgi:hypothetical protein
MRTTFALGHSVGIGKDDGGKDVVGTDVDVGAGS